MHGTGCSSAPGPSSHRTACMGTPVQFSPLLFPAKVEFYNIHIANKTSLPQYMYSTPESLKCIRMQVVK